MPGNPFRGYLQAYLENIQAQNRQALAEKGHELAVKQLEELHNYHKGELERQQAELEHRKNVAALTLKQHLIENIGSGLQQPPESAGLNQPSVDYGTSQYQTGGEEQQPDIQNLPQTHTLVGPTGAQSQGYNYNLSPEDLGGLASSLSPADRQVSVASPEHLAQLGATAAGQKTSAEVAAKEPERAARQKEAETRASATEQSATTRALAQKDVAETRNAGLIDRMSHIDATRKYAVDHNLSQVNQDELSGQAEDASTGIGDLPKGPNGIHTEAIIRQQGKVPFQKADGAKIDSLNEFDGLVQDMQTAANMLPDTTPGVQQAEQFGNKLISKLPWQTDLKNNMASIKAKAPGIVRGIGGVGSGRVTNQEIAAQMDNLINAGMSKQQALGKIAQFQRDIYTKAYSDIMGPIPTKQKVAIMAKHGGLDRWRNFQVSYKGQQIPVIKKMSDGHEAMFDPNKGSYEDIEGLK